MIKAANKLEATFHLCEKHVSPLGLEPRSLAYHSNHYAMKAHDEDHAFHIKVPNDGYTSIRYTPLPGYFLILNLIKGANTCYRYVACGVKGHFY